MHARSLVFASCLFGMVARGGSAQWEEPPMSPEIHADRTATFRLAAPNASEVTLSASFVEGGKAAMERDEDGVWALTVGPLAPDIYGYSLDVDGLSVLDLANHGGRLGRWPESLFLVRGDTPRAYEQGDAPRGVVHVHRYASESLGMIRGLHVYTPPGYSPDVTYPVLYLLHGYGDTDTGWTTLGRAHIIADNLLAAGKIGPMVIVMPHGHAAPADLTVDDWRGPRGGFETDLLADILPFISANYSVATDVERTGIVGLSMGGGQSLRVGLTQLDTFGWIGGFSSATPEEDLEEAFADALSRPDRPRLLWIGCGTDDFLYERNTAFLAWLSENDVPHTAHISGGGHSWSVWRSYLEEFLPLVFRD
ncbi:esterase [Candidatus Poribacteria bacterium]|nr:esterase [Candidatus Poribacteria bacterium]